MGTAELARLTKLLKRRKKEYKKERKEMWTRGLGGGGGGAKKASRGGASADEKKIKIVNGNPNLEADEDKEENRTMMLWLLSLVAAILVVGVSIKLPIR